MVTPYNCYLTCVLVCAILKLASGVTNCTTNSTATIPVITCSVQENVDNNTLVFDLKDNPRFSDISGLTIEIRLGNFATAFSQHFIIDDNDLPRRLHNGELRTKGDFDREQMFDSQNSGQTRQDPITWSALLRIHRGSEETSFQLEINVIDINDNTPTFNTNLTYLINDEGDALNVNLRRHVVNVAVDNDEQHNAIQEYSLQNDYNGLFILVVRLYPSGDSVRLESTSPLDRENRSMYDFVLIARDGGNKTGTHHIILELTDVNDNFPTVEMSSYSVAVEENLAEGRSIIKINATDKDDGIYGTLTYSLTTVRKHDGTDITSDDVFVINQTNGEISTNRVLDREAAPNYQISVLIRDGGDSPNSDTVIVNVQVIDVNDNPPQVTIDDNERTGGKVRENVDIGSAIATMTVTDPDEGINGLFTVGNLVDLDVEDEPQPQIALQQRSNSQNNTWDLVVTRSLDRETREVYNLQITVTDNGMLNTTVNYTFELHDENDNAPMFNDSYHELVSEATPIGRTVVQEIRAYDEDIGTNANIVYSLSPNSAEFPYQDSFSIHPSLGNLMVNHSLDRETVAELDVLVVATDMGVPPKSGNTSVHLVLLDVNDNQPEFVSNTLSQVTVIENSTPGVINHFSATDPDLPPYANVTYSIISASNVFAIDPVTGELNTTQPLDREDTEVHHLQIGASDSLLPPRYINFSVIVEDVNDVAPRFVGEYLTSIPENASIDTVVTSLTVIDPDINNGLQFSIESGNIGEKFSVNSRGDVIVVSSLDRETINSYTLIVSVMDNAGHVGTNQAQVVITVSDVNDHHPQFNQSSYIFYATEELEDAVKIGGVLAVSDDEGQNGVVSYRITAGNIGEKFTINSSSGVITAMPGIDREINEMFELNITATDGGRPPLYNTSVVRVMVRDLNDNGPIFSPPNDTITLREDYSLMQPFYTATAVDRDEEENAVTIYSIVVPTSNFSIDPNSGEISLLRTLDYETATSILLIVQAIDRDQSHFTDRLYLNVSIGDIDDRLPRFRPNFPSSLEVNESTASGSVILTFQAITSQTSPASHFDYTLSDHMGDFALSVLGNEALLEVVSLDRESRNQYSLNITIINTVADLRNSKLLMITVTDANDNPPVFNASQYSFEVMENLVGAEVGFVGADDSDEGDNSMIRFTLEGTSNLFQINPETGRIHTSVSLDYDTVQEHTIVVLATDMGSPSKSTSAMVSITVIDANDNPPQFSVNQIYEFRVAEDASVGREIGTIMATDIDSGDFGRITYTIQAGDDRNHFTIVKEGGNGILTVNAALDRESMEVYNLVIVISDNNNRPHSHRTERNFSVIIRDVNDNTPVFSNTQVYSAAIPENEPVNLIATISANDPDHGTNAEVNYMLGSGNYNDAFSIDTSLGDLRATALLDYEMITNYPLEVIAYDMGSPTRRSVQLFNITVTNVNDNDPQFTLSLYQFSVREDSPPTSIMMTVQAVDDDSGELGEVRYTISSQVPTNHFEIDGNTGVIRPTVSLNYELYSEYELIVEAVDMDQIENRRTGDTVVRVVVENINDNRPNFLNLPHTVQLSETVSANTIAYVASAVDADTDTLLYSIIGGNDDNKFTMNTQTGEVFVSSSLDRDVVSTYELTIRVTDGLMTENSVLTVEVEDVNDNTPVFAQFPYTVYVSEGANVGDVVGGVVATDADEGLNAQLQYTLTETSTYFSINSSSGHLTLLVPLDRDNSSMPNPIMLQVSVTDMGIISKNSNATSVEVVITDTNDSPPIFTRPMFRFTIPRDFTAGVTFGVINATDADVGTNAEHLFDIVQSPQGLNLFNLNRTSGELSLVTSLAGSIKLYWIQVRVVDLRNHEFEDVASVEVIVTDSNDHPPSFPQERYSVDLMESLAPPQTILMLTATDGDTGRNGEIMYEFGKAQSHFTINQSTGDIVLTDSLDHERMQVFTLLVYAVNHNGRNASTIVDVNVLDINDNSPQFQDLPSSLTISEVPYIGLEILHVVATDLDSGSFGQVSYSLITESARSQFNINNVTGVVTNLVELTSGTTHVLEFQATDGGGQSRRMSVTLTVTDLSSQSPDFGTVTALMVPEDYFVNNVVYQFNASSLLDSLTPIQYRISNFTDDVFVLNETTGELILIKSLDFEEVETYHFIIEAYQIESNTRYSSYLEMVVLVVDVNDNAPVFTNTYVVITDIPESVNMNYEVTTVHADDDDDDSNGRVSYEITDGNEGEVFSIGPTSGQIVVVKSLDRESVSTYRLVVTATDEGTPPQSATTVVAVGISDVNDVTPSFRNDSYVFRVSENSTLNSLVGVVSAVDPDLTPVQLRYSILSLTATLDGNPVAGIPLTHFQVNQDSGEILLNHNLDRTAVDKYELQVDVRDGINTNSTSVTILVQDSNNNRPMFITGAAIHSVSIPELSEVGTYVFQFTAKDADSGVNGIVRYSLGDDWPSDQFQIDYFTGIVSLLRAAPLYQASSNGLWVTGTVIASDLGNVPQNSSITVAISLFDVNNHPPSLMPPYSADVFDITEQGTEVLRIEAGDQDQEEANAEVFYYISQDQGPVSIPFEIERTTGRITVSGELTPGNVVFTVIAINENPEPFGVQFILSSTTTVEIRVNRMNVFAPRFNKTTYQAMVLESEDTGTDFFQVHATDNDEDTIISYSIQSSETLPFAIDSNGLISINGEVDREVTDMYNIVVVATDNGFPRKNATANVRIDILDVNDNKPVFMQGVFEAMVMENVQVGTEVKNITASDDDLLENAEITYHLNDTSVFDVSPKTGRIFTNSQIDREAVAIYYLELIATDNGHIALSSSAVVHVTVGGENEFEPTFNDSQQVTFQVPSGLVAGAVVGRLNAYDEDQGSEGELKFTFDSFEGSINPDDYFYINSSGFIILNVTSPGIHNSVSTERRKRQAEETSTDYTSIVTIVKVEDSGSNPQSDNIEITLSLSNDYITTQAPSSQENPDSSPVYAVIAAVGSAVVIALIVFFVLCGLYRYRRRGKNKLYSPTTLSDAESTRPSLVSFTPTNANGIIHGTETTGTRLTAVQEPGHAQVSTTSDSEPASGIFGDDESESVSGMQSRARANNPEHVSPNGRHRSPQHPRPPPISRSTSDLNAAVSGHNSNGFLRRPDDEEAHPYTRDQLMAIYAANANLLTNSPSQDSIHMFGSEGGGEADGDIDMDNYMFAKFAGGLDSADEESVVGMNNDAYTVSSRGRSSIASRSSGGGIDEGPEDLWRGSRQSGFRPHRVTDVIDELHASLSQESLSQAKEKRKTKPLPHMMQFQETSFTKKPTTGSYNTRQTGSMQNVRYPDHVGNSQYEGYDGRRSSKSHYASSGAIYPLSYSSRASELTLPPYRAGEAPPPYGTELSPPLRPMDPAEIQDLVSQSSDSDSSEYRAPNPPVTSYGPQPISPQPSLPTTNSTISLDNPLFQSPSYSKHYKAVKSTIPHPHSGSVPQINMYNAGSVHASSMGQGLDRQHRYNVNNGNIRA